MLKLTYINDAVLDESIVAYSTLVYDLDHSVIFYRTNNNIAHVLTCDFSRIFGQVSSLVELDDFQTEVSCAKAEKYILESKIRGRDLKCFLDVDVYKHHKKLVSVIESCAKPVLDAELGYLRRNAPLEWNDWFKG